MEPSDRRIGIRVDLELFVTQYVRDRPYRVLTSNLSETGLFVHRVALPKEPTLPAGTLFGLELELPGSGEVMWARGQICRETWSRHICGSGVRFDDMPRRHARMIRDYCHAQRKARLDRMLERIRRMPPRCTRSLEPEPAAFGSRPIRRVPGPSRLPIA